MAESTLSMQLTEVLRGSIHRVVYNNPDNGYCVISLTPEDEDQEETVTVVGKIISPNLGERLLLHGQWADHPRFGKQFKVAHFERNMPETVKGIRRYLGSMVRGIGPSKAKLLVDYFGIDTLRIIESEPHRLTEVRGIGPSTAKNIREGWQEHRQLQEIMVFLQGYNISQHQSQIIFKTYGAQTIDMVRENPYRLATDVKGIGFLTADQIARSLGIPEDSPLRAHAAIMFQLRQESEQGHVYFPRSQLLQKLHQEFGIPQDVLEQVLIQMIQSDELHMELLDEREDAIYLRILAACEMGSGTRIRQMMAASKSETRYALENELRQYEQQQQIQLAPAQKQAIEMAMQHQLSIITGGPGTGKTTIIRAICQLHEDRGQRIALAAPTGRAAKRLSESTGLDASTLHRTLEFSPREYGFQRNLDNPLPADILIVDEASMLDIYLFYALIRAVKTGAKLLLVGDIDQLPSVGPGNVLRDLLRSEAIPFTKLNQIFRQKESGLIVENAHRINQGALPHFSTSPTQELLDFYFIAQEKPENAVHIIRKLLTQRIPQRFGLDPMQQIQVLSPMYKGDVGIKNLNTVLQKDFQPHNKPFIEALGTRFYPGDRVLQTKNDYDKDVFNGDVGFVKTVSTEERKLIVCFDEREIEYEYTDLDTLVLAYAISVHKSQGSEYPAVIVPLSMQHYMMMQRNLLYTAITRGKQLVILVGSTRALKHAVNNNKIAQRFTRLDVRCQTKPNIPPNLPWHEPQLIDF